MTLWKPHSLARPHTDQLDLRSADRVVATVDLDGIPQGTEGRILLANGFNWQRYRVLFDNGMERGDLDGRNIAPTGKTLRRLEREARDKARRG